MVANKDPFRSVPSRTRPRLAEDVEKALEPIERRSAACYEHIEESASRFLRLAKQIDEDGGCVPEEVESEESLAVHIREAVTRISRSE